MAELDDIVNTIGKLSDALADIPHDVTLSFRFDDELLSRGVRALESIADTLSNATRR